MKGIERELKKMEKRDELMMRFNTHNKEAAVLNFKLDLLFNRDEVLDSGFKRRYKIYRGMEVDGTMLYDKFELRAFKVPGKILICTVEETIPDIPDIKEDDTE